MKALISTICLSFLYASLIAQGLQMEDDIYAEVPQLTSVEGLKDADLPKAIDLSTYCPSIRNQGDVYSCVGWAVGYGALTIKKAIKYNWQDRRKIDQQAYSAMFIYNQIKTGDCSQGARISDALIFLKNQGDCLAAQFDTDIEDCTMQPTQELLSKIEFDTITDYLSLFPLDANEHQKNNSVIRALARQEPVIVGMAVRKNFYQLQGAKYWWPELGNTVPAGGHAMVVVGYDLASASFLLYNSWGSEWGNKGYIRVKFTDFARFCKYAFIIQFGQEALPTTTKINEISHQLRTISASARLNYLSGFSSQKEPIFKNSPVQLKADGVYTCEQNNWPIGQLFQMAANAEQQGLYLYAFSIDADQQGQIHWPRTAEFNNKFEGMNESALLMDSKVKVTIPGENRALRLSKQGTDCIYLLFASKPIKHLDFIIAKMRADKENHRERLTAIFGKHLVPIADVTFTQNQPSFTANTRSKGYIVPMIIEVKAE